MLWPSSGTEVDAVHEGVVEAADDRVAVRERERIADHRPGYDRDAERGDAHHERVEGVLRADQAGVEEAESRGHQDHQRGRGEHPGRVAGVDRRVEDGHQPPASADRRDGAVAGLPGADPDRAVERQDEDLAVADLAGPGAVASASTVGPRTRRRPRSRTAPSRRAPSSRSFRGTSRPGRAHRHGPGRGSSRPRARWPDRAPRAPRWPVRDGRFRSPISQPAPSRGIRPDGECRLGVDGPLLGRPA